MQKQCGASRYVILDVSLLCGKEGYFFSSSIVKRSQRKFLWVLLLCNWDQELKVLKPFFLAKPTKYSETFSCQCSKFPVPKPPVVGSKMYLNLGIPLFIKVDSKQEGWYDTEVCSQLQEPQDRVQGWSKWANQKVM